MLVVLSTGCNLRCTYCYQSRGTARSMSWSVLRSALDLVIGQRSCKKRLAFYGGEPLLRFALLRRAVDYVENQGRHPQYSITTNGTLLDRESLDFLAGHDFTTTISFDGIPAAQHLRGRGTFAKLDRLLGVLARHYATFFRDRIRIAATVFSQNLGSLADSIGYFLDRGVLRIDLQPLVTYDPGWKAESLDVLDEQLARVVALSLRHYEKTGTVPVVYLHPRKPIRRDKRGGDGALCNVARGQNLVVDVDGSIYTCVGLVPSLQSFPTELLCACSNSLRIGHVADCDLDSHFDLYRERARTTEVFHHRERKYSSNGSCAQCRLLRSCSICTLTGSYIPGNADPHRVSDLQCAFERAMVKYRRCFLTQALAGNFQE